MQTNDEQPPKRKSARERMRADMAQTISPPVIFALTISRGTSSTEFRETAENQYALRDCMNRVAQAVTALAPFVPVPRAGARVTARERVRHERGQQLDPSVLFNLNVQRGTASADFEEAAENQHELRQALNRIGRVITELAPVLSPTPIQLERRLASAAGFSFGPYSYWDDALLELARKRAIVEVHFNATFPKQVEVYHKGRHVCTARLVRPTPKEQKAL